MRVLVTGGAGFIGATIDWYRDHSDWQPDKQAVEQGYAATEKVIG